MKEWVSVAAGDKQKAGKSFSMSTIGHGRSFTRNHFDRALQAGTVHFYLEISKCSRPSISYSD